MKLKSGLSRLGFVGTRSKSSGSGGVDEEEDGLEGGLEI